MGTEALIGAIVAVLLAGAAMWLLRRRRSSLAEADAESPAPRARVSLEVLDQAFDPNSDVADAEGMALFTMRVRVANAGEAPVRLIKWTVHAEAADGWFLNPDLPVAIGDGEIDPANLIFNLTAKPIEPGARIDGMCFALFRPSDIDRTRDTGIELVCIDATDDRHIARAVLAATAGVPPADTA